MPPRHTTYRHNLISRPNRRLQHVSDRLCIASAAVERQQLDLPAIMAQSARANLRLPPYILRQHRRIGGLIHELASVPGPFSIICSSFAKPTARSSACSPGMLMAKTSVGFINTLSGVTAAMTLKCASFLASITGNTLSLQSPITAPLLTSTSPKPLPKPTRVASAVLAEKNTRQRCKLGLERLGSGSL